MFDERLLAEPASRSTENQVDPLIYDEGMSLGGVGIQRSYSNTPSPLSDSTRLGDDEPGTPLAFPEGIEDSHGNGLPGNSGLPGDLGGLGLPELGGTGAHSPMGSGADGSFSLPMDNPSSQGQ